MNLALGDPAVPAAKSLKAAQNGIQKRTAMRSGDTEVSK